MNDGNLPICFTLIILLIIGLLVAVFDKQYSTKNELPLDNENISVYVDPDTGCQYLKTYKGGITLRLNKDGKQICEGMIGLK